MVWRFKTVLINKTHQGKSLFCSVTRKATLPSLTDWYFTTTLLQTQVHPSSPSSRWIQVHTWISTDLMSPSPMQIKDSTQAACGQQPWELSVREPTTIPQCPSSVWVAPHSNREEKRLSKWEKKSTFCLEILDSYAMKNGTGFEYFY